MSADLSTDQCVMYQTAWQSYCLPLDCGHFEQEYLGVLVLSEWCWNQDWHGCAQLVMILYCIIILLLPMEAIMSGCFSQASSLCQDGKVRFRLHLASLLTKSDELGLSYLPNFYPGSLRAVKWSVVNTAIPHFHYNFIRISKKENKYSPFKNHASFGRNSSVW